jgi:Coenzyme PQQ synthesis protein D (PqqD)
MRSSDRLTVNTAKVSHETIDGEVLIINFENGNYYNLLGTGAAIWSMLECGTLLGDIVDAIDRQYSGDRSAIESAVGRFVDELYGEELVVHANGHSPETAARAPAAESGGNGERAVFEAPALNKYSEVQDLLVLDPIHEVDETGWPDPKPAGDD